MTGASAERAKVSQGRLGPFWARLEVAGFGRLAWQPLLVLLALIAIGCLAEGSVLPTSHAFLMLLGLLLGGAALGCVALLAGRNFLATGALGHLLIGCGVLTLGFSGVAAAYVGTGDLNAVITIHDLGACLSAMFHLGGAMIGWNARKGDRSLLVWLLSVYAAAWGMVGVIMWAVHDGWTVAFFTQGQGGSLAREVVLGLAAGMFALTAALVLRAERPSCFSRGYSRYLLLLFLAMIAFMGERSNGSFLDWAGRLLQAAAGVYLLVVAWASRREGRRGLALALPERKGWPVIGMTVCLVVSSLGIRLPFQGFLGHDHPYLTFFVAVMVAALVGGQGAGILATVLSALLAEAFLVQKGPLGGWNPAGIAGLAFFLISGVMISVITEGMHRAVARATRAEARARSTAELERAQEVLRRTVEELTRSNEDLERFAYVASHDLQEPLRMVNAYVGLLRDRYQGRLDPQAEQYIAFATEGAERMHGLIHDLLAYSRVGFQPQAFLPASAERALAQALADLKPALEESGARITHDELPLVHADAIQLSQVFRNLLSNAIKFRTERAPEIHVGFREQAAQCVFSVADNGIGINPMLFHRIFDLFQRLKHRKEYPGTGIGLSICKKIVERHGGRIWVESQPGEGATFFFSLPVPPWRTP